MHVAFKFGFILLSFCSVVAYAETVACNTVDGNYDDGGYDGFKTAPGYMPSDIHRFKNVPACTPGQVFFNETCWDAMDYNADSGTLLLTQTGHAPVRVLAWDSNPMPQDTVNYLEKLFEVDSRQCQWDVGSGGFGSCSSAPYDSTITGFKENTNGILYTNLYTLYPLGSVTFGVRVQNTQLVLGNHDVNLRTHLNTYTNYGKCYKEKGQAATAYNKYQWFNSGSVTIQGVTMTLPLTENTFLNTMHQLNIYPQPWACVDRPVGTNCYKIYSKTQDGLIGTFNFGTGVDQGESQLMMVATNYE